MARGPCESSRGKPPCWPRGRPLLRKNQRRWIGLRLIPVGREPIPCRCKMHDEGLQDGSKVATWPISLEPKAEVARINRQNPFKVVQTVFHAPTLGPGGLGIQVTASKGNQRVGLR